MTPKKPWRTREYRQKVAYKEKTGPRQGEYDASKKLASRHDAFWEWHGERDVTPADKGWRKNRKAYITGEQTVPESGSGRPLGPTDVSGVRDYMPWNE